MTSIFFPQKNIWYNWRKKYYNFRQSILLFFTLTLTTCNIYAAQSCFILADFSTHKILQQQGSICNTRISPCSTFKIALSLIGYDSGILQKENSPVWDYHPEYHAPFPSWQSALDNNQHIGWFIGWITYNNRTLIFVKSVIDKNTDGTKVKEQVKKEILLSTTSRRN